MTSCAIHKNKRIKDPLTKSSHNPEDRLHKIDTRLLRLELMNSIKRDLRDFLASGSSISVVR